MRIPYGSDPNQFGELSIPAGPGPHPLLVFIHGGFWRARFDISHSQAHCEALARCGIAVWSLEYRRIGQPGGGWPGTAQDALAGLRHVQALFGPYRLDPGRLALAGHSAGGHLALWAAAQNAVELRGVAALAAVSDLRGAWALQLSSGVAGEFMGGPPEALSAEYSAASPIELLPLGVPQILIHGTADTVVPFSMSRDFAEKSANARLVPLEDAGHSELIDPAAPEWQTVRLEIAGMLA